MSLVGKKAVHFSAPTVINGNEIVDNFSLDQYLGKKYVVFFFYPKDFTFVCPTELHAFQAKVDAFAQRDTVVVACSTDTAESHYSWLQMPKDKGGIEGVTYPVVADGTKTIATNYGVIAGDYDYNENGELITDGPMIAYRGLFLIDKSGIVQHQLINNFPLGRNVDEAIRMVDALRHFENKGEVCPANWKEGEDAMKATFSGVADYLAAH